MQKVVVVAAKRTAVGNFGGSLASLPAHVLGAEIIRALMQDSNTSVDEINEVIMGQVLTAGCGQNPARQAAILGGIANHVPAMTINKVCGSGLKSVMLGYQAILLEHGEVIIAGGQENMSQAPHSIHLRNPIKMGNGQLVDTMLNDGLVDAFMHYHMGITAENIAKKFNISRARQDELALQSQQRAAQAQKEGRFIEEIIPITIATKNKEIIFDQDEFLRPDTTKEKLATLRPAFDPQGTVTAGNASGINDGAAGVLLMTEQLANKKGLTPLAHIESCASAGVDPAYMGLGPILAINKAMAQARWSMREIDLIESNEAFASQAIAVMDELHLNPEIVNVNGGAIALGHPIGASGARCLVTLIHEMERRKARRALVALCIGGGMGVAMCISRSI